jgi:hypothetical protein
VPPTPPAPPGRPRPNGGNGSGGNGGSGHPHRDPTDPGPPGILLELAPQVVLGVAGGVDKLVTEVQVILAQLAAHLSSAWFVLAGPNLISVERPDGSFIWRIGIWLLRPGFPFAAPDPNHPHVLPVLTQESAAKGFNAIAQLDIPVPDGVNAAFGIFISTATLNALAEAEFPRLQAAASPKGLTLNSVTISCAPRDGKVTAMFEGDVGWPTTSITGIITETLGTERDQTTSMRVPAIVGHESSAGTDVGNEVLVGLAVVLSAPAIFGAPFFLPAILITLGAPIAVGDEAGSVTAMATALVKMIPPSMPFQIKNPLIAALLPAFPLLIFDWPHFGTTASGSGILALALAKVETRESPPRLSLTGPSRLVGYQRDMSGGAASDYTVKWAEIAPDADGFAWEALPQTTGPKSAGPLTSQYPFSRDFTVEFPLPDPAPVGLHHFRLIAKARETSTREPGKTLSAHAEINVVIDVLRNPAGPPP